MTPRSTAPILVVASLLAALTAAGCALPKLPTIASIRQSIGGGAGTPGEAAKGALDLAAPVADAWSANATLVDIRGTRIDDKGLDSGFADGQWLVEFQSDTKHAGYQVKVAAGKVVTKLNAPYQDGVTGVDRGFGGILDSPDAVTKAGLGAKSYTVILRGTDQGPRYDVLGDGEGTAATLDAKSGEKVAN